MTTDDRRPTRRRKTKEIDTGEIIDAIGTSNPAFLSIKRQLQHFEIVMACAEIEALAEERRRAAWRPAPPETARRCVLSRCRHHRRCCGSPIRDACPAADGARPPAVAPFPSAPISPKPPPC